MTYDNGLMSDCENCEALHSDNVSIPRELYDRLDYLGLLPNDTRSFNAGGSDYAEHIIQPWSIWQDYDLNPFDADIIKRTLRSKQGESRLLDKRKTRHVIDEQIRQLEYRLL